ncbi:MAG: beta-ketoacyl-[acyl-carrier-protein] synthase family protein [bacterium]
MHKVAITGIGIISCLGCDVTTVAEALRQGKSGVVVDDTRRQRGFRSPLTGLIRDFDCAGALPKKQRKTMPDYAIQAYAAARDALAMSGLSEAAIQDPETGLVFGCDSSCLAAVEQVDLVRAHGDTSGIGSGQVFRSMTSSITLNLAAIFKTRGAAWTVSAACASGGHAVSQAADLVALGRQERVICGGAQEINWESMASFDALGAFSCRIADPGAASRPFDAGRDGLVPSGGAAALVVERLDLARRRGATILGEIAGAGFSSDAGHLSVPGADGLQRAMCKALRSAGLVPGEIDYICAHATSTPLGDAVEAESISAVFGPQTPWVSSLKSLTGHELWMSGASQVVYSTIMARHGFIAANANFTEADASSAKLNIVRTTLGRPPRTVLCNAAGFGGTNSCLILRFPG